MLETWWCALRRSGAVLVWLPPLLLGPVLALHGSPGQVALQVGLVLAIAASCVAAVVATSPRTAAVMLGVLAALVAIGALPQDGQWLPTWILLAITVPVVLTGWPGGVGVALAGAGSMLAAASIAGSTTGSIASQGFVVLLSGVATTFFVRLMRTVEELRRTREQLARAAVAEERERFSRDLHDLLGHTLSVMVVKAQAVRRLVAQDPDAAAVHAADIERVGRDVLVQVRQTVDAMRVPSLAEELDGARVALDAAGIRTEVSTYDGSLPEATDQAFAWAVREGTTNVLRHSAAATCRVELGDVGGELVLTVSDDGVGGPHPEGARSGGLDGLRRRLAAEGGRLDVEPDLEGFRLTARIPHPGGRG